MSGLTNECDRAEDRGLTTWREIAGYLGVTQRTAQTWHKSKGLPVRKHGRRVESTAAELDRWRRESTTPVVAAPSAPPPRTDYGLREAAGLAVLVIVLGAMSAGARRDTKPGEPARIETHNNLLLAYRSNGALEWSHPFAHALQEMKGDSGFARSLLTDLDGDGRNELLFVPWDNDAAREVYCFDPGGAVAWRTPIGRNIVQAGGRTILSNYWPVKLAVLARARPDGGRIVLLSHHNVSWPALLQVFDIQGRQVAEYWHAGWLFDMTLADLNSDGVEEIVAGGVNNSFLESGEGAIAIVLDSRFESGQGPVEKDDHRVVQGLAMSGPLAAIRFPNIPEPDHDGDRFTKVTGVEWVDGHLEIHLLGPEERRWVDYRLDGRLEVKGISASPALAEAPALDPSGSGQPKVLGNGLGWQAGMLR